MRSSRVIVLLVVLWCAAGGAFLGAAFLQRQRLNLSPTAGGQFPYLAYAKGIAEEGITDYFGDRNRMPLIPALTAMAYDTDLTVFFRRATAISILISAVLLLAIGAVAYATLPPAAATLFGLLTAVTIFLPKASFVQAELAFYTLFFGTWLVFCRLLLRPKLGWAVVGGVLLALAYLTKSSAAPLWIALVVTLVLRAVVRHFHSTSASSPTREGDKTQARDTDARNTSRHSLFRRPSRFQSFLAALVVKFTFLLLTSPYLFANYTHFGQVFYNVNSTFFMWCDNWTEAEQFARAYEINEHYPEASSDRIPGPLNYWRTHTFGQMVHRLAYGLQTLGAMALHSAWLKYLLVLALAAVVLGFRSPGRVRAWLARYAFPAVFTGVMLAGYLFAYAWYVPVAYGDRFLLSLVLPVVFALLWLATSLSAKLSPLRIAGLRFRAFDLLCAAMSLALLFELGVQLAGRAYAADPVFIRFYYNESRARLDAGDLPEARRGFTGVIKLDPAFAPAYLGLGMVDLLESRPQDAIVHLREAIRLRPNQADAHNSLGSALLATGRPKEAVAAFRLAVDLDPDFATAWYNLGGTLASLGRYEEARKILPTLQRLNPRLAADLARLLE
ncbi:MAG: tetratricopeptide repeat protein [Phycisphaerae bacterium]|nr:tetratricopeptide repeat protein [Phycisphaerae bacterium]